MILIDSNVLIDILGDDPKWFDWSLLQIAEAVSTDSAVINHVVMAEVAPHHASLDWFRTKLLELQVSLLPMNDEGAYAAGLAFREYRRMRDGTKSVIADFLIGGHAEAVGSSILTRDPRFYRTYFPTVPLIAPIKDDND